MSKIDQSSRWPRFLAASLSLFATVSSAATLRLSSQTWVNLIGGGVVHSPFDYDEKGLRTQRRDFNSTDSSGPRIARTIWEYDDQARMVRQVQFGVTDTVSILTQSWNGDKLALATLWGKGGIQRYRDTSIYDSDGNEILRKRFSPSDSLMSQHTWTYDSQGQLATDTTWQPQSGNLVPVLAMQTSWQQGRVVRTQEWSRALASSRWNAQQRTDLAWNGTELASTTNLSGDGTGRILVDSTAYTYDASGNKSTETTFNADRVASARTTFVWEGASAARIRSIQEASDLRWKQDGSRLVLDADRTVVEFALMDAQGRSILRTSGSARSLDLGSLPQGRYLASAIFAEGRSVHAFTHVR